MNFYFYRVFTLRLVYYIFLFSLYFYRVIYFLEKNQKNKKKINYEGKTEKNKIKKK